MTLPPPHEWDPSNCNSIEQAEDEPGGALIIIIITRGSMENNLCKKKRFQKEVSNYLVDAESSCLLELLQFFKFS